MSRAVATPVGGSVNVQPPATLTATEGSLLRVVQVDNDECTVSGAPFVAVTVREVVTTSSLKVVEEVHVEVSLD